MRAAIFTVTKGGREQGLRVQEVLGEAELYSFPDFQGSLATVVSQCFETHSLLIFIMATGIVVRTIAPLLKHKSVDPAVLVMDEGGKHVISLLSGHLGGANGWTLYLAEKLGADPVITTASDIQGIKGVDTFAMEQGLNFADWKLAKEITAHLVNGGQVKLVAVEYPCTLPLAYQKVASIAALDPDDYALIISPGADLALGPKQMQLFPQDLVLGMGCRRDTPVEPIMDTIEAGLKLLNRSPYCVKKLVTVDVKKDERGLQEAAKALRVPLEIVSREAIQQVQHRFQASDFVQAAIGVTSVSGPCAYLGSGGGKILLDKFKGKGTTLSIAQITGRWPHGRK